MMNLWIKNEVSTNIKLTFEIMCNVSSTSLIDLLGRKCILTFVEQFDKTIGYFVNLRSKISKHLHFHDLKCWFTQKVVFKMCFRYHARRFIIAQTSSTGSQGEVFAILQVMQLALDMDVMVVNIESGCKVLVHAINNKHSIFL
jgi:hypothetical protein